MQTLAKGNTSQLDSEITTETQQLAWKKLLQLMDM